MICSHCKNFERKNTWICPKCAKKMEGGLVFVTGISGSDVRGYLSGLVAVAKEHGHPLFFHDIGESMHYHAREENPDVQWDRILDDEPRVLNYLRRLAFQKLDFEVANKPDTLHIVNLHLSFRWKAYLTRGIDPHWLTKFTPNVRCFINIIEDLLVIQKRLGKTTWRKREILELLIWRDEELFLTNLLADVCGRVDCYAVSVKEPTSVVENLVWHPEMKKVYLSFPITAIFDDKAALNEIESFRDEIREFLIVFDPYASKDYDETYKLPEMKVLRKEVGETTIERDYRFIDQADAIVVYYPKKVPSKGVDAEMNHARLTGKDIYLYCPEDLGGGPFAVPASHFSTNREDYIKLLKEKLAPLY